MSSSRSELNEEIEAQIGARVLEHAPCLVAVIDKNRNIVWSNPAFQATFDPAPGTACYTVYKGRENICEVCPIDRCFEGGEEQVHTECGVSSGGKQVDYQVRSIPIGEEHFVLQISSDITQLRHLEQGLKQAEHLATLGLTAAGLAHTIKNIVAGLEGATYAMESGYQKDDKERLKLGWEMVHNYIDQVTNLVRNLLDYAREKDRERSEVDAAALVEEVVALFEEKAGMAGITLAGSTDDALPLLWADREALHACLSNLVTNAIDACMWDPDSDREHRIDLRCDKSNGGVTFEVEDNGMGISAENQQKVLAAFFTTKGMRGTGLGLLLTKKAVEDHNGHISFTSTHGKGTMFRISIPQGQKGKEA